ncbi:MAG: hypothetical protein WED33_12600 [Bacteroidia bacterium]
MENSLGETLDFAEDSGDFSSYIITANGTRFNSKSKGLQLAPFIINDQTDIGLFFKYVDDSNSGLTQVIKLSMYFDYEVSYEVIN